MSTSTRALVIQAVVTVVAWGIVAQVLWQAGIWTLFAPFWLFARVRVG